MATDRQTQSSDARDRVLWSTIIFVVALSVRTWHLIQLRAAPLFPLKIGDAEVYDAWARRIAAGDWWGEGVFYQAPLYPYFLGSIYTLLGDDVMTVRKCQAVIGALSCLLLANAAWNLFSKRAGIAAGLILAVYAPAVFFDCLIQKSVLDLFFLCLVLWLISLLVTRPNRWHLFWLGLSLGGLILTRENALVLVPVIGVWIFLYRLEGRAWLREMFFRRSPAALIFGLGLMLVLLPVAWRNYAVGGEFHLTTSQLGPNFYIGNHPQADGLYRPLKFGRGHARFERSDATEIANVAMGRELTPREVSDYFLRRSADYIMSDPGDWLRLIARKFALTWNATEITDSEDQYTYAEWSWPLRLGNFVGHFGVLVPLAVFGLWTTWPRRNDLWLLYLMLGALTLSVVAFYVFARYRYPLAPLLIMFAAAGLANAWRWSRQSSIATRLICAVSVCCAALFCNQHLTDVEPMQATTLSNVGNALAIRGELDQAVDHYRRALALDPTHALAHNNLAAVHLHQGQLADAIAHYERALQLQPEYANASRNLDRARRLMANAN